MALSPFEQFVNQELPTRIGTIASPVDVVEGTIPVTTGAGLQVIFKSVDDVLGQAKTAFDLAVEGGFVGTLEDWLESLIGAEGKSAFDIAVDLGFTGNEQDFIDSLKGEDGVIGVDGQSAYALAVEQGFQGDEEAWLESLIGADGKSAYALAQEAGYQGTEEELAQALAQGPGVNGAVFVTDVVPVDPLQNAGDKVQSDDGHSLVSFSTTTTELKVEFVAITGHTNYRPNVTVNGVEATLIARDEAPLWDGSVELEVTPNDDGNVVIVVEHEDGAIASVVGELDVAPKILSAKFASDYPAGQTELKADDEMDIEVIVDMSVVAFEIANHGAFKATSGIVINNSTTLSMPGLKIADRGNVVTERGFQVRVQKASGAWSDWFETDNSGQELQSFVKLNNLKPTINVSTIEYPPAQFAIKAGDSALIKHDITDYDTVTYGTIGSDLNIANPTVFDIEKVASYASGDYNDGTNNFNIVARRSANGATTTYNGLVRIANVVPTVSVSVPAARLRSGGNHDTQPQRHTITLTSNQALSQDPILNLPEGNWEDNAWKPNATRKVWTRGLIVHDDDAKGQFDFNGLVVENGSGLTNNDISGSVTYTLGGFVLRNINVAAYPNRIAEVGTMVADTTKLRCSNLSKGSSGSLNFTYQADDSNAVDRYTILNNTIWYNCDAANATSNTSGLMIIELEEVV